MKLKKYYVAFNAKKQLTSITYKLDEKPALPFCH
jgi:hypothetical protein